MFEGIGNGARTLVLYDTSGPFSGVGELHGTYVANLVSHFGSYTTMPAAQYQVGDMMAYTAVVYVGSTYDEPLPEAFLDDTLAEKRPVIWLYDNIWRLTKRAGMGFIRQYGFNWKSFDVTTVAEVRYKGESLTRYAANMGGIMDHVIYDTGKVKVLAEAVRKDGTTIPWALRSRNLTYIGELPGSYTSENDRSLIFADLLFDTLAPATPTRRRAMVRIEDIGPGADPEKIRAIADLLGDKKIPFSLGIYTRYQDPLGLYQNGIERTYRLRDRPELAAAYKYAITKGAILIMHGVTHQFGNKENPYSAVSADDFEFFSAHVDDNDYVRLDGPVPGDSTQWAQSRVKDGLQDYVDAGLPKPIFFEFPHYAASAVDYRAIGPMFSARYERGLYFPGLLRKNQAEYSRMVGQFFPYVVRDVYGSRVLPENLGHFVGFSYNNHSKRLAADVIDNAKKNLVIRDGFASFFFHWYNPLSELKTIVEGISALGYQFVSPASL